jgi:cytochrome P450
MLLSLVLLSVVICLIAGYIWRLRSRYEYFKQRRLPGPPPTFLFGHYLTFWSTHCYSRELEKWTKQYGPIYGLFEGSRPIYVVSDVDFLHEVYIKQFTSFHSRRLPFVMKNAGGRKVHLLGAGGAKWRRQRHVINPTFSTAKLKLMSPLVNDCIQSLTTKLENYADNNEELNIYTLYKRLTMDVICRCAFGIETDMQNDVNNMFLRKAQLSIDVNPDNLTAVKLANIFPILTPLVMMYLIGQMLLLHLFRKIVPAWFLPQIEEMAPFWILNRVNQVINMRTTAKSDPKQPHPVDLLQLMLDASTKDAIKVSGLIVIVFRVTSFSR